MPEIDRDPEILEDYEPVLKLKAAFVARNRRAFDDVLRMVGRTIRTAETDFPDICAGNNFLLMGLTSPEAAIAYE